MVTAVEPDSMRQAKGQDWKINCAIFLFGD